MHFSDFRNLHESETPKQRRTMNPTQFRKTHLDARMGVS